ncbi:hypothetical protein [Stenotrophomonas maltophilia]|uniref:hypothetical protein n=1 Tax=Stenotrophomonas maltophilia TaxID=40324 RepID=UPI002447BC59|nr:hypothetical protein [Stenotrophomonas maltophilia]MDH0740930.1 hypothetical protein [Stenotrophomonas maltophilia]MDH1328366.1 hypothetical protein [Stenotrophomonas maltophilia]
MPKTRQEIQSALDALRDQLPRLASDEDADFDYLAFESQAQALVDEASHEDRAALQGHLSCLLASAGLIPSESEGAACAPSVGNRASIDRALNELDTAIPRLRQEYGDEFWSAFAGHADVIEDNAGADAAYVEDRITAMLVAHGLQDRGGESSID